MNNIYRVSLSSGIIGSSITSPKRALENCIKTASGAGEEIVFVVPDQINIVQSLIYGIILFFTLFMWCPAPGYLVITRPVARG